MAVSRAATLELLLIGAVHAVNTASQNAALGAMSVGLNQVVKSATPAVTLALSWLLLRARFHWSLVLATTAVVGGSVLTTLTSGEATVGGILACATSVVFGGLESVLIDGTMSRHKLHAAQITLLTAIPASVSLLVPFVAVELTPVAAVVAQPPVSFVTVVVSVALLSVSAGLYSFAHYLLIGATSAHYVNLVGCVKVGTIMAISVATSARWPSALHLAGVLITLAAFSAYSVLRTRYPEKRGESTAAVQS